MYEDLPDLVRAADRGGALAPHDHDAGPGQNLRIVECKYRDDENIIKAPSPCSWTSGRSEIVMFY